MELISIVISAAAGVLLRWLLIKKIRSVSDKEGVGNSLVLLMISITGIIIVVKSSIALSLGLVGALSITRYRTAIKEPVIIAVILFAISIAIALGAGSFWIAFVLAIVGCVAVLINDVLNADTGRTNMAGKTLVNMEAKCNSLTIGDEILNIICEKVDSNTKIINMHLDNNANLLRLNIAIDGARCNLLYNLMDTMQGKYQVSDISVYGANSLS